MISKKTKFISIVLAVLITMTCFAVLMTTVSAAAGDTVYCKNDAGWSTVYCYMWNSTTKAENKSWPGVAMTSDGTYYSYVVPSSDYDMIIFNNGSGTQTSDLSYPGHGKVYNNSTKAWSDHPNPAPTTTPSVDPTQPTVTGSGMVYCKNSSGWSNVTVYMWNNSTGVKNATWPGQAMTNTGDDVWSYAYNGTYTHCIFSINGGSQTSDLTFPGNGYIYDNKSGGWEIYDTSPLRVLDFSADLKSPQYEDMDITFSTTASGEGAVYYSYYVKDASGNETMLSDFSADSTVVWHPTAIGTYTITVKMFDEAGNENKREMNYTIESMSGVKAPIIKSVSPVDNSDIAVSSSTTITANAGGGNVGTNLLFYKFTIYDQNNNLVNVPYYTLDDTYSFTPTAAGVYTVKISVQASDNKVAEKTIQYEATGDAPTQDVVLASLTMSGEPKKGSTVTFTAIAAQGVKPYKYSFYVNNVCVSSFQDSNKFDYTFSNTGEYTFTAYVQDATSTNAFKSMKVSVSDVDDPIYLKGDADGDGVFNINDATIVQKYAVKMVNASKIVMQNADVNGDGDADILDATHMQKKLCKYNVEW